MGMDAVFFWRLHYKELEGLKKNKSLEMIWHGSDDNRKSFILFRSGAEADHIIIKVRQNHYSTFLLSGFIQCVLPTIFGEVILCANITVSILQLSLN